MPVEFRQTVPEDLPGIAGLLQAAFEAAPGAPFLDRDLLLWKYFDAAKSYVLVQDGHLLAHGCAWPVPGSDALCLIDWASAKTAPGMGIMLARKIGQLAPVMLSIGGSSMTRQIMPKIGFKPQGELLTYARVLRPWKQFWTRPGGKGPRALLRLARNSAWSLKAPALRSGWDAVEEPPPDDPISRCPAVRIRRFEIPEQGKFLMSRVGGQSRVVRMDVGRDLSKAYAAAIGVATADREACELVALAQDGPTRKALHENGFIERDRRTVYLYGPLRVLHLDMLADDLFYMNTPEYPFYT